MVRKFKQMPYLVLAAHGGTHRLGPASAGVADLRLVASLRGCLAIHIRRYQDPLRIGAYRHLIGPNAALSRACRSILHRDFALSAFQPHEITLLAASVGTPFRTSADFTKLKGGFSVV